MRTSVYCLLLLCGLLIFSGCARQDVPAPTYSVKGHPLKQKLPVTASATALFNACTRSCTENPNYGRQDFQACLDTCYALHREFPMEHRQYSTQEKCIADTESIINSYEVIMARYNDWCEQKSTNLYKRRACKDAVTSFYSALSPESVCLRTTEAMKDAIAVQPAEKGVKPRLTVPPAELLTMSPVMEGQAQKTVEKKQSKAKQPPSAQSTKKTLPEKTANTIDVTPVGKETAKNDEPALQPAKSKGITSPLASKTQNTGSPAKQPAIIDTKPADSPQQPVGTQESSPTPTPPSAGQNTAINQSAPNQTQGQSPATSAAPLPSAATNAKNPIPATATPPAPQPAAQQPPAKNSANSTTPSQNTTIPATQIPPAPTAPQKAVEQRTAGQPLQPSAIPALPSNTAATELPNQPVEQKDVPARLTQEEQEKATSEKQLSPDKSDLPMILPPIEEVKK